MRRPFLAVLALLLPLVLAACGAPSTPDFLKQAAMGDVFEVEAGKIAAARGKSEMVKQFGQHMVEAHTHTTAELKGVAQAQKINLELPVALDEKHQLMIDDLMAAQEFDKIYARQQIKAHEAAVELFSDYAEKGDDPVVKAFAAKTLAEIKQHLEAAKALPQ
jgi:putative membrane protein